MQKEDIIKKAVEMYKGTGSIDIVKLAINLGLEVEAVTKEEGYDAQILHDKESNKYYIRTNINRSMNRIRFSLAHELAHYLLHNHIIESSGSINRPSNNNYEKGNPVLEKEANSLAAEILMPEELVNKACEDLGLTQKDLVPLEALEELADRFDVSRTAMAIRLEQLGFVVNIMYAV